VCVIAWRAAWSPVAAALDHNTQREKTDALANSTTKSIVAIWDRYLEILEKRQVKSRFATGVFVCRAEEFIRVRAARGKRLIAHRADDFNLYLKRARAESQNHHPGGALRLG